VQLSPTRAGNTIVIVIAQQLEPTYEALGIAALAEPWEYALAAAAGLVAIVFCAWMYRRDSIELPPGYAWLLLGLRLAVLVALALYLADVRQRTDRLDVQNSRVAVLVDTSLSMARSDPDLPSAEAGASRMQQVVRELTAGGLVEKLRERHDVHVYRFDQEPKVERLAIFDKRIGTSDNLPDASAQMPQNSATSGEIDWRGLVGAIPRPLAWTLAIVIGATLLVAAIWFTLGHPGDRKLSLGQFVWLALGCLAPSVPVLVLIGLVVQPQPIEDASNSSQAMPNSPSQPAASDSLDSLNEKLRAAGLQTRLGDALADLLRGDQTSPLSGVMLFTDGGHNAGIDPAAAIAPAKQSRISLYPVGMGSDRKTASLRIAEFSAPPRVFPGDGFDVVAHVQATNLSGRLAKIELFSSPAPGQPPVRESEQRIKLAADGEIVPVNFSLKPTSIGRRTYTVRVEKLAEDAVAEDNEAQATVDIVERKLRVLLFAGGPSREYQYLRNQLRRDAGTIVDVLLQIAKPGPGISQDANEIRAEFPRTREDMAKYDAIVAFDPDWRELDATQADLLEDWVGNQAGGLVVAAGPVFTGVWSTDLKAPPHQSKIRGLYPVVFPRRGLSLASDTEKFRSTTPWTIQLSRAGLDAPFLRLEESPAESQRAWDTFPGVFGYYPVEGPKPAAIVYGRYATPDAPKELPVYFAGHFYGAGRVFYMGSGEMWRLREADEAYFERFYTKLLRHVAEGRMLRGTQRGSFLVERRRYVLGDRIDVNVSLRGPDQQPLAVNRIAVQVKWPDATSRSIELAPRGTRPGVYHGDFVADQQGNYTLSLEPPGTPYELVTENVRVLEPDLEGDHARRNDVLLRSLAEETGGKYYVGVAATRGDGARPALVDELRDATRKIRVRGAPSPTWDQRWATWLLGTLLGLLFVEWTMRRLARLA
jgi:hypothetical protein